MLIVSRIHSYHVLVCLDSIATHAFCTHPINFSYAVTTLAIMKTGGTDWTPKTGKNAVANYTSLSLETELVSQMDSISNGSPPLPPQLETEDGRTSYLLLFSSHLSKKHLENASAYVSVATSLIQALSIPA